MRFKYYRMRIVRVHMIIKKCFTIIIYKEFLWAELKCLKG